MKCKYCNADIEKDAQFCTNCGKDLSKFERCVNCGELLDHDTVFCPYCGTEQTKKDEVNEQNELQDFPQESQPAVVDDTLQADEERSSKKWVWAVIAVILLAIIGGGVYFATNGGFGFKAMAEAVDSNSIAVIDPSDTIAIDTDIHSVEGIKARVNEIFTEGLKMSDSKVVDKFFSEDFRTLYKKVDETDKRVSGEIGFWEGGIWDGRQDDFPNAFEIVSLNTSSPQEAYIVVNLIHNRDEYHSEKKVPISLVFENGNWFIDEISEMQYKESMKEYIEYWQKKQLFIDAYSKVLGEYVKKGKNDTLYGNYYFLHDITGDGFSELWIQVEGEGDDNLNCQLLIYEYKNGAVSKIYQKSVGHPAHHSYILMNNNIYMSFEHMGDSQLEKFEYKNGIIQSTMGTSQEVSDYEKSKGQDVETYEMTNKESLSYI